MAIAYEPKNVNIAYIGGGSMDFGWRFIGELCNEPKLTGTVRLYDIEKKYALANEVIASNCRELDSCRGQMVFFAVDSAREALKDADFVVLSISCCSIEERMADLSVPEEYGIYQAAGDSAGPGGIMRAIRTVPEYIKYANLIKEICPKAWVISLTEPMAICIKTLYKAFPEIKAFGCSNEPRTANILLRDLAQKEFGVSNIDLRDIKSNIIGIPSLTWMNDANYDGNSLFDIYAEYAKKYSENDAINEKRRWDYKTNPYISADRVKMDMFLRYGLICAASDRHIADSCPPWYIKSPKVADFWKMGRMNALFVKAYYNEKVNRCRKLLNGEDVIRPSSSETDIVLQIKAICGICNIITNAVMINHGQVENLPIGTVVETNVLFSKNSVKPTMAGTIPEDILSLIHRQMHNTNMLCDAIFDKNLDYAYNVFLNDPLMTLDINTAFECFKKMLNENKKHLAYYCD